MSIFDDIMSDPRALNTWGSAIEAGGKILSAQGAIESGDEAKRAAEFEAEQLRYNAGQAQAAAQRQAFDTDRQTRMVMSRALAVAAASGGGASDPTVVNIIAQTAAEGAYRKAVDLYQGDDRARAMLAAAHAKEIEGASAQSASRKAALGQGFGAITSLLKGSERNASLYQRFGGGGPQTKSGTVPSAGDPDMSTFW